MVRTMLFYIEKPGADGGFGRLRQVHFIPPEYFTKSVVLRLLLDLNSVLKGEYHAAIGVHNGLFYARVPELERKISDGRFGGFPCFLKAGQGTALYLVPVALCLYAFQTPFQFRKPLRHPLIFALILALFNAASDIAVDERTNVLRYARYFVAQSDGFFFEAGRIRQARHPFFCVLEDEIPVRQQRIERRQGFLLDGFFSQARCIALFLSLEFAVALPDDAAVFVRGMPSSTPSR